MNQQDISSISCQKQIALELLIAKAQLMQRQVEMQQQSQQQQQQTRISPDLLKHLLLNNSNITEQKLSLAQKLGALQTAAAPVQAVTPETALASRLLQEQIKRQELQQLLSWNANNSAQLLLSKNVASSAAPSSSAHLQLNNGSPVLATAQNSNKSPQQQLDLLQLACLLKQEETKKKESEKLIRQQMQDAALVAPMVESNSKRKGRTGTFPQKLHQMLADLEQEGRSDIASFIQGGAAFMIHKPKEFAARVMAKYFRMSRFSSFQRQLNLYDFERVTEGPDKGAYYHELFVQGRPILSCMMKRTKIKGVKNNASKDSDNNSSRERKVTDDEESESS